MLLYQTLIFTEICGALQNNSFAADVRHWEATGNATRLLAIVCKQDTERDREGHAQAPSETESDREAARVGAAHRERHR